MTSFLEPWINYSSFPRNWKVSKSQGTINHRSHYWTLWTCGAVDSVDFVDMWTLWTSGFRGPVDSVDLWSLWTCGPCGSVDLWTLWTCGSVDSVDLRNLCDLEATD